MIPKFRARLRIPQIEQVTPGLKNGERAKDRGISNTYRTVKTAP